MLRLANNIIAGINVNSMGTYSLKLVVINESGKQGPHSKENNIDLIYKCSG